jgi:hypothetical protein
VRLQVVLLVEQAEQVLAAELPELEQAEVAPAAVELPVEKVERVPVVEPLVGQAELVPADQPRRKYRLCLPRKQPLQLR